MLKKQQKVEYGVLWLNNSVKITFREAKTDEDGHLAISKYVNKKIVEVLKKMQRMLL